MYVCKSVVLALRMYIENIQILRASPREQRTTLRHELLHVSVADSGDGFPSDNQNDFTDHFWHRQTVVFQMRNMMYITCLYLVHFLGMSIWCVDDEFSRHLGWRVGRLDAWQPG